MIKFLNFNPQNVGKVALRYNDGVDTSATYNIKILNR